MNKEIISDRLADIGVKTIEQVLKLADEQERTGTC